MKNKVFGVLGAVLISCSLVACGQEKNVDELSGDVKEDIVKEDSESNSNAGDGAEVNESDLGVSFEDLSKYTYEFSSGAGGWNTEFEIEDDGTFIGSYHDSEMGVVGEGYDNGTLYYCDFSGSFSNIRKIDEFTYEMDIDDISYAKEPGTEEIMDNVLWIYSTAYGLDGTDKMTIYLPGKPVADIDEEIFSWFMWNVDEGAAELNTLCLANEPQKEGIYTFDRPAPLERAQLKLNSTKSYYDDAFLNLSYDEEGTSKYLFKIADDCLNSIWHIVKYSVDEEKFAEILEEQRAWNESKEAQSKESDNYELSLAELTLNRCYDLVNYLQ